MSRLSFGMSWSLLALILIAGCGPANKTGIRADDQGKTATTDSGPSVVKATKVGPTVGVKHNMMAEVMHVLEGVSRWNRRMSMAVFKGFEERYGIDEELRPLLKKVAFARLELWEKGWKSQVKRSFEQPFGSEGLMPPAEADHLSRFWQVVLAASEPAALKRSLAGVLEPADAEALAEAMRVITPKVVEIIKGVPSYQLAAGDLQRMLDKPAVDGLLAQLAKFFGLASSDLRFTVHPFWLPASEASHAMAYGDHILVGLPEGKRVGPEQVALVVAQITRRMMAKLSAKQKVLVTGRFVERAGLDSKWPDRLFLVEMLADAAGFGLAAPMVAEGPAQVPAWPGDDVNKRLAEATTGLLRATLKSGKKLDGAFAIRAAKLCEQVRAPKPADFVDGAMVIAQEPALKPFKAQVQRWMVWKFPLNRKYNYPLKLDYAPGRSVLMMLTPRDLGSLPKRFAGRQKIVHAFKAALAVLKKHKGVIVTVPRDSRGYIFIIGAAGPKAMEKMADTFFAQKTISKKPVVID
ncbi:MAG: hypothetical protein JRF33_05345 [Deltaproteobacteria bacterium]|nr:hypothetical protein [Deltaproteobacteria bacterium]